MVADRHSGGDGADRFRFHTDSVPLPELLRLVKQGKPTAANKQFALAA
jgi:hypothetical protein